MKTLFVIPSPFSNDQETQTLICTDYPMPSEATFPDGTVIEAMRINAICDCDGNRIYAIRIHQTLVIFSPDGEDATAAAVALSAQVDPGVPATPGDPSKAFYVQKGDTKQ